MATHREALLEKIAHGGEMQTAIRPIGTTLLDSLHGHRRIADWNEIDCLATLSLRRVTGTELVDDGPRARHALAHPVTNDTRRLDRRAKGECSPWRKKAYSMP